MTQQEQARAYRRAAYWVQYQPAFSVRVGQASAELDALLAAHDVTEWAFITAYNPYSQQRPPAENAARDAALCARLATLGLDYIDCDGVDDDGTWPTEHGHIIFGIGRAQALALGRQFEQNAILVGRRGCAPELAFCEK